MISKVSPKKSPKRSLHTSKPPRVDYEIKIKISKIKSMKQDLLRNQDLKILTCLGIKNSLTFNSLQHFISILEMLLELFSCPFEYTDIQLLKAVFYVSCSKFPRMVLGLNEFQLHIESTPRHHSQARLDQIRLEWTYFHRKIDFILLKIYFCTSF